MSVIQEIVKLGSKSSNVMTSLITVISELDWILLERGDTKVVFREKRRFDHFNHVEGEIDLSRDDEGLKVTLKMSNNGIGTVQEDYLNSKVSEFLLLFKEQLDREKKEYHDHDCSVSRDIEHLSRLHQDGELTDEEFQRAKTKVLED